MTLSRFSSLTKSICVSLMLASSMGVTAFVPTASASQDEAATALTVTIDRAKVVRIAKSADTIIVGNPSVVDATIQDSRTVILTGRNFGVTNLIVLDSDGNAIVDETIVVQGHETNTVRVYRQAVRETLACSPVCENTLTIGDENENFMAMSEQIKLRTKFSEDAAKK